MSENPQSRPKVLIIGAGLGGITLGILLEKAGVPYTIFEKSTVVRPLGSAISLGPMVFSLLEQIGLAEQFMAQSKPLLSIDVYNERRELVNEFDNSMHEEKGGHHNRVISRPILYDMLLNLVPPHKLHLGKRVTAMEQTEEGVMIQTSEGQIYEGEILVGADGAYSSIRQNLYERLDKIGKLPISDAKPLPFRYIGLVGQTTPQNPKDFPELKREDSPFKCIIGDHKHSAAIFTTQSNAMAWIVVKFLDKEDTREKYSSHKSDWGPTSVEEMCKAVHNFAIPGGNGSQVLGDLIDKSPKHLISKIMMEEKLFHTWYHQRTVLIGDACHKMHPIAGLGAVNAMQDAVTLANWLNILPSGSSLQEVENCFKEYRDERFPLALKAFRQSEGTSALLAQNFFGRVTRFILSYLPKFIIARAAVLGIENRPQVAFLPPVVDRGTIKPIPQRSLFMTKQIILERTKALVADHKPEISWLFNY